MSREQWFRFYERVKAEHPELTDEQAAHRAGEELYDARCEAADNARKMQREEGR
jgi:hypothetical protein